MKTSVNFRCRDADVDVLLIVSSLPVDRVRRQLPFGVCYEQVYMPRTIKSPAKCEVCAVKPFFYAEGSKSAEIHREMSPVQLSWKTAKFDNDAGTLKQNGQTSLMQAATEESDCH